MKTVSDPSLGSEAYQGHRQARHCIACLAIYGPDRANIAKAVRGTKVATLMCFISPGYSKTILQSPSGNAGEEVAIDYDVDIITSPHVTNDVKYGRTELDCGSQPSWDD